MLWRAIPASLLALTLAMTGPAWGAATGAKAKLTANQQGSKAKGKVDIRVINGKKATFRISAQKLSRQAPYTVVVRGVAVGTVTTSKGGSLRAMFRDTPRKRELLLGFDPRGAAVSLRDATGAEVMWGDVPVPPTKRVDAGKIACCVPDDGGFECEDRLPDVCAAQGGTPAPTQSCLPDPCGGRPDVDGDGDEDDDDEGKLICCQPDDDVSDAPSVECEDRSAEQCAMAGGVILAATSCEPDPCSPTGDPVVTQPCCVLDDGEPECETRTPARCARKQAEDGACDASLCGGTGGGGSGDDDDSGDDETEDD